MSIDSQRPATRRRVIFYLVYDERGDVDAYIPYKLERLRPFADHIVAMVNGTLSESGQAALEPVVDEVWMRDNVGWDVGAYQDALARFGQERLAEFDELILMNYTWFGPVRPFEPVFERMEARDVDFWGITDHGEFDELPEHIQSHWIAVRRSMFLSEPWVAYWRDMPVITSYDQSIALHETRFTQYFNDAGFSHAVAFPQADYESTAHPAFDHAQQLLDEGNPVLKRRPFFHDPLYLDREAVIGRRLLESAAEGGYPQELILQSVTRNAHPRGLNTTASMMEILPDVDTAYRPDSPLSIAAVVHIYYEDMADELLDRLATLPSAFDLYVTTSDEAKAEAIRAVIAHRTDLSIGTSEVRIVESNRGRDQSAFYITCRDVLLDGRYDVVVKIHSKRSVQDGANAATFFQRQQLDNLLNSPGYTANLLALFQREPGLGMVFPPMIHIGYPTMGNAWFTNRPGAKRLRERLGIHVPLDTASPLAPYGGMFIARPEALRLMAAEPWTFDDYPAEGAYGDGTLSHVQERMIPAAAAELGYHSRTVATLEYAAISHTFLEYKLDALSHGLDGFAIDQVHAAQLMIRQVRSGRLGPLKYYLTTYHPRLARSLADATRPLRAARRRLRR